MLFGSGFIGSMGKVLKVWHMLSSRPKLMQTTTDSPWNWSYPFLFQIFWTPVGSRLYNKTSPVFALQKCSCWSGKLACFYLSNFFLKNPSLYNIYFLVVGLPKDQFPIAYLCKSNAYAHLAIRSYIISLLLSGNQMCALLTLIIVVYPIFFPMYLSTYLSNLCYTVGDQNIRHIQNLENLVSINQMPSYHFSNGNRGPIYWLF